MPDPITASPLSWPLARKRTPASERKRAPFGTRAGQRWGTRGLTVHEATRRVLDQLDGYTRVGRPYRVPSDTIVISTNLALRLDGLPRSNQKAPEDPGVAVYFELDGQPVCLPCDTYTTVPGNLAAVAGHIEADRRQERYGVGTVADRFASFLALPEQGTATGWRDRLGVGVSATVAEVRAAYKARMHAAHPDTSDDPDPRSIPLLRAAYAEARAELGF